MNKQLVNTLLRVFHSPETRFSAGRWLREFCETYNIGQIRGASLVISARDKAEIALLLKGKMGIDAQTTYANSWNGLTRGEGLNLAKDEKLAGGAVGEGRLQVKALRGRDLSVCGRQLALPDEADLGLPLEGVLGSPIQHDGILIVENKQTFNDIWHVHENLLASRGALNPLVVFRGDAEGGSRVDAVHHLISETDIPVYAFVDFDPTGMVIASALPRLDSVVCPDLGELSGLLKAHGLAERFMKQLAAARKTLERLESDSTIGPVWGVIRSEGKGLPQEFFHRQGNDRPA
jgi:hypothetical protein